MDKKQAEAASEVVMSQSKAEQARRRERLQPKQKLVKPWWRVLGLALMGCGVGIAAGSGSGSQLSFGVMGFGVGMAMGVLISRRQG